jgi:hypothetical protein
MGLSAHGLCNGIALFCKRIMTAHVSHIRPNLLVRILKKVDRAYDMGFRPAYCNARPLFRRSPRRWRAGAGLLPLLRLAARANSHEKSSLHENWG